MILTDNMEEHEDGKLSYTIKQEDGLYGMPGLEGTFFEIPELILCCKENSNFGLHQLLRKPCAKLEPTLPDLSSKYQTDLFLPRSKLEKGAKLAKGNFASVWLGIWQGKAFVAIKQVKQLRWSKNMLLESLADIKALQHPNIVRLYGVCKGEPLFIVTELLRGGSLRDYMRSDEGSAMSYKDQLDIGRQIACGMAYIEDMRVSHRDLAAKNVLLGTIKNTVKIADCALVSAVDNEYIEAGGIIPVRWSAPEMLRFKRYSIQSDVWAYGIVLVEIVTHGQLPYFGYSNVEVIHMLYRGNAEGKIHKKPAECPDALYDLMTTCWEQEADGRPSFHKLLQDTALLHRNEGDAAPYDYTRHDEYLSVSSCDPTTTIMVAMHNYAAMEDGDLSFRKGDTFEVLKWDTWHRVRHLGTGEEGLIPANYVTETNTDLTREWYHPDISRTEAEQILKSRPPGTFLIRKSEELSLSVVVEAAGPDTAIEHYRIRKDSNGMLSMSRTISFADLASLVRHYTGTGLLGPACRKPRPILQELSTTTNDKFELDRTTLQIETKLAAGQFGEVWKGLAKGTVPVAIKKSKNNIMSRTEFMKEATVMKHLLHPHVVRLYGVCSDDPIFIVTEFVENGSLREYLREDTGPNHRISFKTLVYMALQVANGMSYLETMNYIHRDLAARNILVSSCNLVKIADFGLARAIPEQVYVKQNGTLPVKWTAPEGLERGTFSVKSDVWSYGILLVEIFMRGGNPYPGQSNTAVSRRVMKGGIHDRPAHCPDDVYQCMTHCWERSPSDRPSFAELVRTVAEFDHDDSEVYQYPRPN